jgi:anti-sigma factor RsiW
MTPEIARAMLHAYIDGELDPASTMELRAQIEASPTLRQELTHLSALQNLLQNRATRYQAPAPLAHRAFDRLPLPEPGETPGGIRSWWRTVAIGSSVAAVALLFWSLGLFVHRGKSVVTIEEIFSAHVRSLMADHLTDLTSAERHSVKPWLSNRLDFAPPVHELAKEGYPLVGARLDYLGGKPAAAIVYRHRQHVINVFIWPSAAGDSEPMRASTHRGYNAATFSIGGMTYWIISDLNAVDLRRFSELLQRPFTDGS